MKQTYPLLIHWHMFLLCSEVCSTREQKTIIWHGAFTMHMMDLCNGTTVHYVLEGSEPRCSEECEHIIVGLDGERVQVCLFRRCCATFWSLEELCLFFDCCNNVSQVSQKILSCKVPTKVIKSSPSVSGPYDPKIKCRESQSIPLLLT